ncbi:hypothetical protein NDU88_005538 [Pleurodeles waltl]|uniref:Uncharacterized protein n=1 Tax=Pleurodeles waltl TaxID=8319 RepID=A0AAV7LUD2_PLEWA|nr:hypothetical protein NDU88_005538 [Pleurodeles waltl]
MGKIIHPLLMIDLHHGCRHASHSHTWNHGLRHASQTQSLRQHPLSLGSNGLHKYQLSPGDCRQIGVHGDLLQRFIFLTSPEHIFPPVLLALCQKLSQTAKRTLNGTLLDHGLVTKIPCRLASPEKSLRSILWEGVLLLDHDVAITDLPMDQSTLMHAHTLRCSHLCRVRVSHIEAARPHHPHLVLYRSISQEVWDLAAAEGGARTGLTAGEQSFPRVLYKALNIPP